MEIHGMLGERLGVIGQPEKPAQELPTWKKDFLSLPSISTRRGIAWNYSPPYEDTDTLVLTAPSGKFVDIRFPKHLTSPDQVRMHPSFWAFSGESKTTFHDSVRHQENSLSMPYMAHCKFIHDVDSRGPGINDEGDMFLLANGDVAEMGMMMNPSSGTVELYKEYWSAPNSQQSDNDSTGTSKLNKTPCLVAEVIGNPSVKGIVIRVGGFLQGVVGTSNGILSERCTLAQNGSETRVSPGEWTRDPRSNIILPTTWICEATRNHGDSTTHNGVTWEITECHI